MLEFLQQRRPGASGLDNADSMFTLVADHLVTTRYCHQQPSYHRADTWSKLRDEKLRKASRSSCWHRWPGLLRIFPCGKPASTLRYTRPGRTRSGVGGGLQIAPNGMRVLAELGLAEAMIARGSVAESFDFCSQSGRLLGSINRNMKARFGQPAVNMCRATLNETVKRARCANVELHFEKRLVSIEDCADRPIVAHFADGTSAEGDFPIGADGVHLAVRAHVIPDGPNRSTPG